VSLLESGVVVHDLSLWNSERLMKSILSLILVFGLLMLTRPAAAQGRCDAAAINDRMDTLIATYLTERTRDALGAAQDLQAGIAELTEGCPSAQSAETTTLVNNSITVAATPTPAQTPLPQATPTAAEIDAGAVVAAGAAGDTGLGFTVQVTGLVRPANDVIESQSRFNPEPASGEEYVVVVVVVECITTCDVDSFDFALTGDSGAVYSGARAYYENRLNVRGAGGTGDLPFLIRADETNLRLLYLADRLNDKVVAYEVGEPRGAITVASPEAVVTSTPEGGVEVVANTNLNIRAGPGTRYRIDGSVPAASPLIAYGRSEDSTWLRVVQGWVFAELVTTQADVDDLPVVDG
jgi:hypothetical protein